MSENLNILLREAVESDIPFIFNSWLKSYRNSDLVKFIANPIYFAEHHKLIERILKTNTVLIACNTHDTTQIIGWCCAGHIGGVLTYHYLYVKDSFRGFGVAHVLKDSFKTEGLIMHSHSNRVGEALARKWGSIFHPYSLYYIKEQE